jgi:hypothetical protein
MLTARTQAAVPKSPTGKAGVRKVIPSTIATHPSHLGSAPWRMAQIPLARSIVPSPTGKNRKFDQSKALSAWNTSGSTTSVSLE